MITDFFKKNNKYFENFYVFPCPCYNESMQILFVILMFVIGSAFGSFLCCQARRLNLREKPKKGIKKASKKQKSLGHRSVCFHCNHQLAWYENIPIFSWLFLRGKCKKCHKKIGILEFLSELGLGAAFTMVSIYFIHSAGDFKIDFAASFPVVSPMEWCIFAITLIFTMSLAFLAIYDGMSGKLPVIGLIISVILAAAVVALRIGNDFLASTSGAWPADLLLPIASGALFGGIYLILYIVSKGTWVGDGDWILAGAIGLGLGHPWLAMIALFIANFSACIIMYPIVKNKKNHQIYFGPFLVLAFVITYSFSDIFLSFFN